MWSNLRVQISSLRKLAIKLTIFINFYTFPFLRFSGRVEVEHWTKMRKASNLEVWNLKKYQVTSLLWAGPSYIFKCNFIDILNTYSNFWYIRYIFSIQYIFNTYSICVSICSFSQKLFEEKFTLTSQFQKEDTWNFHYLVLLCYYKRNHYFSIISFAIISLVNASNETCRRLLSDMKCFWEISIWFPLGETRPVRSISKEMSLL